MNAELEAALDRMLKPLDESRLSGVTASEDARCMGIIAQALRDQDAEIARLDAECRQHLKQALSNGQAANKARALLKRARAYHVQHECPACPPSNCDACLIDAYLGAPHDQA